MLKTSSFTGLSTIWQSSINEVDEDEVDGGESCGNKKNLSNPSMSKNLTLKDAKRGGGNIKKGVKAARGYDYLTPDIKNAFNYLRHAFTQAPIFQHFDPERHIQIQTNVSGYSINEVLSQVTLNDLGQWHLLAYYSYKIILAKT